MKPGEKVKCPQCGSGAMPVSCRLPDSDLGRTMSDQEHALGVVSKLIREDSWPTNWLCNANGHVFQVDAIELIDVHNLPILDKARVKYRNRMRESEEQSHDRDRR